MARLLRPLRDIAPGPLAGELGVTRIARLTGLDRTSVEVASAVRPDGHVLQVTNGKGERFADAAMGALMEAAELWAAERPSPGPTATAAELRARLGEEAVLGPGALAAPDLQPDGAAGWDALRISWCPATPLEGGGPLLVPAQAVHCPPPGGPALGPRVLRWTSNGMGAHPDRAAALLHALLEAIERDRLARALPEGFTAGEIARRLVDPRTLARAAPRTAARVVALEARGFRVHLLDVGDGAPGPLDGARRAPRRARRERGGGSVGLPVAAALLVDEGGGAVPVAAGYACRPGRDEALSAALLEAAQSRATEIHGAREDVLHGDRASAAPLARLLAAARPARSAADLPDLRVASAGAALRRIVGRLGPAGIGPALAVDLAGPAGVHVVKVLAPGLLLSELL